MNKATFLDRDGVINRKAPKDQYITEWKDFEILPGVAQAIRTLNQAGWLVIVVTNQRAIAKRLLSESGLLQIHRNMVERLSRKGAAIDAIYYCPHDVGDNCECRKPKPGMILQAAREHHIDLSTSWMVGDSAVDVAAGVAAGCRTISLKIGVLDPTASFQPDFAAASIGGAAARILENAGRLE